jgi:hypothetical protein
VGFSRAFENVALSRWLRSSRVSHPWALEEAKRYFGTHCRLSLAEAAINGSNNG